MSTQLKRLERKLGTPLFDRLPRGVALTQAGAALLPLARQVLSDVEQVRRAANELTSPEGGTLRVGATPSLAEEDLVLVVGESHQFAARRRIRIKELNGIPLVVPRDGYNLRMTLFAACRHTGFEPPVACDGGELDGVLALVARGLGPALVPSIVASQQPGLHMIRVDQPRLVRTIGLAQRVGALGPPSAKAFAAEVFTLLHDAGWPGLRPAGLRLATGTDANVWGAQVRPPSSVLTSPGSPSTRP